MAEETRMEWTAYPHVNNLLYYLLPQLQRLKGNELIGLYLYGSVVGGDYDDALSDVDLLAVLEHDVTEVELEHLGAIHRASVTAFPRWENRVEVAYVSQRALRTFKTSDSTIGIISPGEALHRKQAGIDWLINWYPVQEVGVNVFGPPPTTLIAPITRAEYLQSVRHYLLRWRDYRLETNPHHGSLAYLVLTLCRGLCTLENGELVSKIKAAAWAKATMQEWSALIEQALLWRSKMHEYGKLFSIPSDDIVRFVDAALDRVAAHPND